MDHFNATVQDGHMVATRRGLRVSKQKFNGLSFVNSYAQSYGDSDSAQTAENPGVLAKQYRFVQRARDSRRDGPAAKQAQYAQFQAQAQTQTAAAAVAVTKGHGEPNYAPDGRQTQVKKARRRARPQDHASPTSSLSDTASSTSSPTISHDAFNPGEEQQQQHQQQQPQQQQQRLGFFPPPSPWLDAQQGGAAGTDGVIPGLAAWTTQDLASFMSEETREEFQRFCAYIPRKMCPYEDIVTYNPFSPVGESIFYQMMARDLAAIHCVLMCGSIADGLVRDRPNVEGFNYHIAKICSILNRKLDQNKTVDSITVFCIYALANMGVVVGRMDYWHMHMNGMQKLVELNGGLGALWPGLRAKVHEVDIKGATVLGSIPYFSFVRSYPPISTDLPLFPGAPASTTLSALLSPLGVDPVVIDSLSSLAHFAGAVALSRASGAAITFDPYACTDDWLGTTHDLLTRPAPLRSATMPASGHQPPTNYPFCVAEPGQSYVVNYRLEAQAAASDDEAVALAARSAGGPLEPALRLAGLLLLKELMADFPRNRGGYALLLALLRGCMRALLQQARRQRTSGNSGNGGGILLPFNAAAARPAVLWLCAVGALVSALASDNEGREGCERYDTTVYRVCAVEVAGLAGPTDVDKLTECDMRLFRLLDPRNTRGAQGMRWEERAAFRELISVA